MNPEVNQQVEPTPAKQFSTKQAIEALKKSAAALRKNPIITAEYDPDDPRPPRTVDRKTWMTAANNLLEAGVLSKEERKEVQNLKRGLALSSKKK
ncbi:hypothetical protein Phage2-1_00073 [Achromobacter phage 2-1]|nr:hypothetical protein Phage2-1_00073 [Achromobacter phage 2-1]